MSVKKVSKEATSKEKKGAKAASVKGTKNIKSTKIKKDAKLEKTVKATKPAKKSKETKESAQSKKIKTVKVEQKVKKEKSTGSAKKNLRAEAKSKKQKNAKNIFDPAYEPETIYEDDNQRDEEKDIDFSFKKEKDLERELTKDDDIFDMDPDEDEMSEIENDEKKALQGFETEQEDIFNGVPLDDNVRMYLKEIGQFDLLNPEQEKKLAKEKQQAQDLLKKKNFDKLLNITKEDAIKLPVDTARLIKLTPDEVKIVKKGELAQEVLINRNLRLVVSIAKRYIGHGLSLLDLIEEGNLGLIRGIEKFDYKMGFKLSTYVTWWIRQAVSRALADQSKTIRIPVHMVETINRLNKVKKKLTTELGYEPSIKQIAKKMKMSEEKVEEVMQIALDPISLDKPVGDEDDSIVADFIADQNVMSPEKYAEMVLLKEQIQNLLSTLKERERKVLTLRFGIGDDRQRTLEEVGKELKVTRERIRQIEDKALRKLKFRAKNLQNYVE